MGQEKWVLVPWLPVTISYGHMQTITSLNVTLSSVTWKAAGHRVHECHICARRGRGRVQTSEKAALEVERETQPQTRDTDGLQREVPLLFF